MAEGWHPQLDLRLPRGGHPERARVRAATSRAYAIALQQNYRSTKTILDSVNGVIRTTASARRRTSGRSSATASRSRASRSRTSMPRPRYVAAEMALLIEGGLLNGSEIAVFYRTNAQSRVPRTCSCARGSPYQVDRRPALHERAEVKDLIAYLQVVDNRYDAVSLSRIANRRGAHRLLVARAPAELRRPRRRSRSGRRPSPRHAGVGAAPRRRCGRSAPHPVVMSARSEPEVPELIERVLEQSGTSLRSRRSGRSRRRGGSRTSRSSSRSRASGRSSAGAEPLRLPAGGVALLRPGRDPRRGLARDADDPPQREGPRVQGGLPDRHGGGDLPALALDRGAGSRGGAAPLLRRHDAARWRS